MLTRGLVSEGFTDSGNVLNVLAVPVASVMSFGRATY